MPVWVKYLVSVGIGFGSGALTAAGSGAGVKGLLIGGAVGAFSAVGNLQATSPADHSALGKQVSSVKVKATREGLPGQRTASGYVIDSAVSFVALPSVKALHRHVRVTNPLNGKSTIAEVLDVGPFNVADSAYVFGGERPQAESGVSISGKGTNRAGIDLGERVWRALEMHDNTDVEWTFLQARSVMMTDCQRVANDIGLLASQAREMVERESEDYDGLEEALDLLCDYALFLERHLDDEVSRNETPLSLFGNRD